MSGKATKHYKIYIVSLTWGFPLALFMTFLHILSMVWYLLLSTGSCLLMSSELKMGSKYSHWRWHCSHSSITSWVITSLLSHVVMRSSNGFLYGENDMLCAITMWSSNSWEQSSLTFMMNVPVSLYGITSSMTGFHSDSILSRAWWGISHNKVD